VAPLSRSRWPWLALLAWSVLQLLIARQLQTQQRGPIDFLTYQIAADELARAQSPYGTIEEDLAIWRSYHQLQQQWRNADASSAPVRPGPYIYPPTLALIISQTGIGAVTFVAVIVLSVIAFVSVWLKAAGMHAWWILFVVFSWDIFASASGGNAELVILGSTMAAARILWSAQPACAAPFVAFVLLVKPFYFLFFAVFVAMLVARRPAVNRSLAAFAAAGVATLAIIGIELYRWGPALLDEALEFTRSGIEHHWFVLPVAEQTPMSVWNRTLLQGLTNAGLSPSIAVPASVALWCALTGVTIWRVSRRPIGFSRVFALAFVLLYLGRPVGWTLNYLEFVVLAALWPAAGVRMQASSWSAVSP
jgi:hypothetical protein